MGPRDVARMKAQPHQRFTELYGEHYLPVLRFVRRRAHPLNVDDIVSETFLAAWIRRDDLPDEPLPWLFATARNVMLNSQRGSTRQRALAVRLGSSPVDVSRVLPGSDRADDSIAALESRLDCEAAFSTLSPRDQEVLALCAWEDLDASDAAQAIGCSRATYSMRLTRARRRLAKLLAAADAAADSPADPAESTPPRPPHQTADQAQRQIA